MRVWHLDVDDKDIDTDDGYDLYFDNPYLLGTAVETALKNGFEHIRITKASPEELAENNLLYGTELEINL